MKNLILTLRCADCNKSIDAIVETDGCQRVGGYIYHCGLPMLIVKYTVTDETGDVLEQTKYNVTQVLDLGSGITAFGDLRETGDL